MFVGKPDGQRGLGGLPKVKMDRSDLKMRGTGTAEPCCQEKRVWLLLQDEVDRQQHPMHRFKRKWHYVAYIYNKCSMENEYSVEKEKKEQRVWLYSYCSILVNSMYYKTLFLMLYENLCTYMCSLSLINYTSVCNIILGQRMC